MGPGSLPVNVPALGKKELPGLLCPKTKHHPSRRNTRKTPAGQGQGKDTHYHQHHLTSFQMSRGKRSDVERVETKRASWVNGWQAWGWY